MKAKLILFLFLASLDSCLSAEEVIFKFKLKDEVYSGVGEVGDPETDLCCTMTLLKIANQYSSKELSEFAKKFIGKNPLSSADLTYFEIAPTLLPNDPFKEESNAWVNVECLEAIPTEDNKTLKVVFGRSKPTFCDFKMILNGVDYTGTAEVVSDRFAVFFLPYFVPRTVVSNGAESQPDVQKFVEILINNIQKLSDTSIYFNNTAQQLDMPKHIEWIPVEICKVTSAIYTRVFYKYSLGSHEFKMVNSGTNNLANTGGTVKISRIGPTNMDQFAFLSIPLKFTGFLSLDKFTTDVTENLKDPTQKLLINIEGSWWQLKIINAKCIRLSSSSSVAIIVPIESEKLVLRINHNGNEYLGYVLQGANQPIPSELLCLKVKQSKIVKPATHLELNGIDASKSKEMFEIKNIADYVKVKPTFLALHNIDSNGFKSKNMNWAPIYIDIVDYANEDYATIYYKVPEIIDIKFKHDCVNYDGVGEVDDSENDLRCTITLLRKVDRVNIRPQESMAALHRLATSFMEQKTSDSGGLHIGSMVPKTIPNDPFKEKIVIDRNWIEIELLNFRPTEGNASVSFVYRQRFPRYCNFMATLNNVTYYGSAEVTDVKGVVSYFVPKSVNSSIPETIFDLNTFMTMLSKAHVQDSKDKIPTNSTFYIQWPRMQEKDQWQLLNVRKVTSSKYSRVFYNYSLESAKLQIVGGNSKQSQVPGSVQVSRIGDTNKPQFSFLSIPLKWTGLLSLEEFPACVIEAFNDPTKSVLISIDGTMRHLKRINAYYMVASLVAIVVPSQAENLVLRINFKRNVHIAYVSNLANHPSDPELQCLQVKKSEGVAPTQLDIIYTGYAEKKETLNMKDVGEWLSDSKTYLGPHNFESHAFILDNLKWTFIYIETVDALKGDYATINYTVPKTETVNFRVLVPYGNLNQVHGTVTIERTGRTLPEAVNKPKGWSGDLSLTNFYSDNYLNISNSTVSVSIYLDNSWWLLQKKVKELSWSLNSSFVATISAKNIERWVVVVVRGGVDYFGYVTKNEEGEKYLSIDALQDSKPMSLLLHEETPGGKHMNNPLTVNDIDQVQSAALTQVFEQDSFAKNFYHWFPIQVENLQAAGMDVIKMNYKEPTLMGTFKVLLVDSISLSKGCKEHGHLNTKIWSYNSLEVNTIVKGATSKSILLEFIEPNKCPYKMDRLLSNRDYLFVECSNEQYLRFNFSSTHLNTGKKLMGELEYTVSDNVRFKIEYNSEMKETFGTVTFTRRKGKAQDKLISTASDFWEEYLLLTKFFVDDETIDATETLKEFRNANIFLCLNEVWWLVTKVKKHLDWSLDSSFVVRITAKQVNNWLLRVEYQGIVYYGQLLKPTDDFSLTMKIDYVKNRSHMKLYKNAPSSKDIFELPFKDGSENLAREISASAKALQTLEYHSFQNDAVNWSDIYIESVEATGDTVTIKYTNAQLSQTPQGTKACQQCTPTRILDVSCSIHFKNGITTTDKITVVKGGSDKPKFSSIDAPAGWNGRLTLTEFKKVTVTEVIEDRRAEIRICVNGLWCIFKTLTSNSDSIQGVLIAKKVQNIVLAISVGDSYYYGIVTQSTSRSNCIDIKTSFGHLDFFKNGPKGHRTHNGLHTGLTANEIQRSSKAKQTWERGTFENKELVWTPIWIQGLQSLAGSENVQATYLEFETYKVIVEYSYSESFTQKNITTLPREVTIKSPFKAEETLDTEKPGVDESRFEVILQFDKEQPHIGVNTMEEMGEVKLFLRCRDANLHKKIGFRRIALFSQYMGSKVKFLGKILSLRVIFWIQLKDSKCKHTLKGLVDEKDRTITIQYDAKAEIIPTGSMEALSCWRTCLESEESRKNYTFGMHRDSKQSNNSTNINLKIEVPKPEGNYFLNKLRSLAPGKKPIIIHYIVVEA